MLTRASPESGRVLRVYKLDELPQLLNVVIGNMSLVGPRPEAPEFVNLHNRMQCRVLKLMPGITDPAAIHYSDLPTLLAHATDPKAFYLEEIRPDKIRRISSTPPGPRPGQIFGSSCRPSAVS